ncbi:MAG: 23S rRNA (uracil(1939)-C(5))-methyltransferase RlmD [Alphaproteobacteria bacterium]|nr:23S rRNA (uracil(1939)-C(5))-methyltransferase RlmD [Alphaproteobacteria bacterium]
MPKTTPILNNIYIENLTPEGNGLAKFNGKIIFVEGAVTGDWVDVRIVKSKKDFALGVINNLITPSNLRVPPRCTHFGVCGGCQWQMLNYTTQIESKQALIEAQFKHLGKFEFPKFNPILKAEQTFYYRNKVEYSFSSDEYLPSHLYHQQKNSLKLGVAGFHKKGFFEKVIHVDTCHLQNELSNKIRLFVVNFLHENQLSFYQAKTHLGWFRNLVIKNNTQNEWMVNMVVNYDDEPMLSQLANQLQENFKEIIAIFKSVNSKFNDSLFQIEPQKIWGSDYIIQSITNIKYAISPKSFFQTNPYQAQFMLQWVKAKIETTRPHIVYDLYCGTGSIGLYIASLVKKVIGIEIEPDAIKDAQHNMALNCIDNCSFMCGNVVKLCTPEFMKTNGLPNLIIVDPPRNGLENNLIDFIINSKVEYVIYISCNPATQVRDLNILCNHYNIIELQPLDMFPQTKHLENMAFLTLKNLL